MADQPILYRDLQALSTESLIVETTVRRVPAADKQIIIIPASNENTVNLADPDESIDVLVQGFDTTIPHNTVVYVDAVALEATRNPAVAITSSPFRLTIRVADLVAAGVDAGSIIEFGVDNIRSNQLTVA
jgi:hypothetical protein